MILLLFLLWAILLLFGLPIAFSIGNASLFYFIVKGENLISISQKMISGLDSYSLLAIPLFILVGKLMNIGGVTKRIFDLADCLVGHVTGGLGHVNIVASMLFAGMSGSATADVAGLGMVEIEAMTKRGYDVDFSAGITAASSTIGPIIPPSIPFVLFGCLSGVSIGALFIAGFVPGTLMGISLMIMVYLVSRKKNYPKRERARFKEIIVAFKKSFLSLLTPVIIIGGILGGVFTATEAGAIGVLYAIILGMFLYKEIRIKNLLKMFLETVEMTGIVLLLVAVANIFAYILTVERIAEKLTSVLFYFSDNPLVILFLINILLFLVGCVMEPTASQIILVPILLPLIKKVGIVPLHFGVIMVLNLMIGLSTPPVGMVLYVTSSIAKISFERMTKAVFPFLIPLIITLIVITCFPIFVTFLPNLFKYTIK